MRYQSVALSKAARPRTVISAHLASLVFYVLLFNLAERCSNSIPPRESGLPFRYYRRQDSGCCVKIYSSGDVVLSWLLCCADPSGD